MPSVQSQKRTARVGSSNLVVAMRKRLGMTQLEFARVLGVSFVTVNRWENGRSKPSRLALRRLQEVALDRGLEFPPRATPVDP